MAGMRIGYAIGSPDLIKALNDVKYSFNSYTMNLTAIVAGTEAVKDEAYFREGIKKIITTRNRTEIALKELGFTFPKSGANFIFVTHEKIPAKFIFEQLREKNVYVRYFNLPRIDNYLRISIGTDPEMDQLLQCLENIAESYKE
jgi:histidinol-phosphate aminotransferase